MKLFQHIAIRFISATIIAISASMLVSYFATKQIMYHNIDKQLRVQKEWVTEMIRANDTEQLLSLGNDIFIEPADGAFHADRIQNKMVYDPGQSGLIEYRMLEFTTEAHGNAFKASIRTSLAGTQALLRDILWFQATALVMLILVTTLINRRLDKGIWTLFYNNLEKMRNYSLEEESRLNLRPTKISELDDLNRSVDLLARRNRELYNARKESAEDISHEIQLPLAILRSNLDLLWQTSLTEEQAGLIVNLSDAAARMNRLNQALLILAKIENERYTVKSEISIGETVKRLLQQTEEITKQKQIQLATQLTEPIVVTADRTLIELLASNLIQNAIRYTPADKEINIVMRSQSLMVCNTAQNGTLDPEKLFKRFQKQTSNDNSTGLGLEICKKICDFYGYDITYEFEDGFHRFRVIFNEIN